MVHATTLSRFIEDPIYDRLNVGLVSFSFLAFLYVTVSAGLIFAFGLIKMRSEIQARYYWSAFPFGYLLCLPLFLFLVFCVPLQS